MGDLSGDPQEFGYRYFGERSIKKDVHSETSENHLFYSSNLHNCPFYIERKFRHLPFHHRTSIGFSPLPYSPYDRPTTPKRSPPMYPGALFAAVRRSPSSSYNDSILASTTLSSNSAYALRKITHANAAYMIVKNMHIIENANDD